MSTGSSIPIRNQFVFKNNMFKQRMAQMCFNNKNSALNKPAGMNASPAYLDQMYE